MNSATRFMVFFLLLSLSSVVNSYVAPVVSGSTTRSSNRRISSDVWGLRESRKTALSAHQKARMMSSSTLERPPLQIGTGPAVLDRPQETDEPIKERRGQGYEAWEVRIYNDGMNTREHVARSLVQVTGMSEHVAYQTMMQAHQNGIAVVGRWVYEVAEMYHDALKNNGIVCDIVPVEEE